MEVKFIRHDYLVPLGPVNFGVAMPSIAEAENGNLIAVWYGGSIHPISFDPHMQDSTVYFSVLEKDKEKWTLPKGLDQGPEFVHASPVVFKDITGRIWCIYKRKRFESKFSDKDTKLIARTTLDGGRTWTDEEEILVDQPCRVATSPLVLPNGEILMAVTLEEEDGQEFGVVSVYISSNNGKTWKRYGKIASEDGTLLREPSIFRRKDGIIQIYMRSCGPGRSWSYYPPDKPGRVWESHSYDNGRTWSKPKRTSLVNNESTIDALELPSGTQIICYNNTSNPDWNHRWPLNLAYSVDQGKRWEEAYTVHPGPGYICHPNMILGKDSFIHIVHTCNYPTIRYVCLKIQE